MTSVADYLREDTGAPVEAQDVIMTVGAGGALNVALKAILARNRLNNPFPILGFQP